MELDKPIVSFTDADEWEAWLEAHHETSPGVYLRMGRKGSELVSVDYAGALQVALCFGWIDGQRRSYDDTSFLQKFTPRTKKSPWSKINIAHVERLIAAGRMRPAGQAAIDAAKADGRWERAYASPSKAEVPDDFRAALDARPEAAAFFATLGSSARFPFLYRIQSAVRPETRAKRIAEFVELLASGRTLR